MNDTQRRSFVGEERCGANLALEQPQRYTMSTLKKMPVHWGARRQRMLIQHKMLVHWCRLNCDQRQKMKTQTSKVLLALGMSCGGAEGGIESPNV